MIRLLGVAFALGMLLPLAAEQNSKKRENPSIRNVPPAGVHNEQVPRATEQAWPRRTDKTKRRTEGEWRNGTEGEWHRSTPTIYGGGYHPTGRERAAQVSRGKHKGWHKNTGSRNRSRK